MLSHLKAPLIWLFLTLLPLQGINASPSNDHDQTSAYYKYKNDKKKFTDIKKALKVIKFAMFAVGTLAAFPYFFAILSCRKGIVTTPYGEATAESISYIGKAFLAMGVSFGIGLIINQTAGKENKIKGDKKSKVAVRKYFQTLWDKKIAETVANLIIYMGAFYGSYIFDKGLHHIHHETLELRRSASISLSKQEQNSCGELIANTARKDLELSRSITSISLHETASLEEIIKKQTQMMACIRSGGTEGVGKHTPPVNVFDPKESTPCLNKGTLGAMLRKSLIPSSYGDATKEMDIYGTPIVIGLAGVLGIKSLQLALKAKHYDYLGKNFGLEKSRERFMTFMKVLLYGKLTAMFGLISYNIYELSMIHHTLKSLY